MKITIERETLEPCPFCGSCNVSKSMGQKGDGTPWPYIECEDCAACAEIDGWNRRAALAAQPAEAQHCLVEGGYAELAARMRGRADYIRDQGGIKSAELMEQGADAITFLAAQPAPAAVPLAQSITDAMMDCVDRLGSEASDVDPRVWDHLLVYAPAAVPPEGGIVVSKNEAGQIVCVSRQDEDGQFLSIIAESADAVPPGMALVPIEPTPGIITTGTVALMKASDSDLDATREEIAATYRAMIAAAGDKP